MAKIINQTVKGVGKSLTLKILKSKEKFQMMKPNKSIFLTREDYKIMEGIFLKSLSAREKKTLQKLNPFRRERNDLIRQFSGRGVRQSLLAHVSGISTAQIGRIVGA